MDETLHRRLGKLAEERGDAVALRNDATTVTFSSLNGQANSVALELLSRSLDAGALVGVWSAEPVNQLILSFGVWKAGMTAVVMDTRDPESRVKWVLDYAGVEAILTVQGEEAPPPVDRSGPVLLGIAPGEVSDVPSSVSETPPAVVLFTSGSEGKPKGVVRTHENMLRQWRYEAEYLDLRATDRVAQLQPLNFSAGLKHAVAALMSGAASCFYDIQSQGLTPFEDWLSSEDITVLPTPIAFFRRFLHHARKTGELKSCRCIQLGGERLYRRDVENARKIFGEGCRLVFTYGATESGCITANIMEPGAAVVDPVPVGVPVANSEIRILEKSGKETTAGELGEIAVISDDLPPGYWRDPESTSQRYIPSPEGDGRRMYLTGDVGRIGKDGMLHLVSRRDRLVKIRGYRVDAGEIEVFLNSTESVIHAVVAASEDNKREPRLTAYLTFSGEPEDRPLLLKTVKKAAREGLPAYMVPDDFVVLEVIPTTNRGKIDRDALRDMTDEHASVPDNEAVTDTERKVIEVWEKVLELEGVSIDDDVMDLGVKSLSGMELCLVLGKVFSVDVPYAQLTLSPTVRELAAFIESEMADKATR